MISKRQYNLAKQDLINEMSNVRYAYKELKKELESGVPLNRLTLAKILFLHREVELNIASITHYEDNQFEGSES